MNILRKISNYLDLYKVHIIIIWLFGQIGYLLYILFDLKNDQSYTSMYNTLGDGLLLAKVCASIINYNFAYLFIFMNKIIVYRFSNLSQLLPSNYHIQFHLLLVFFIIIASIIHSFAHIYI